MAQYITYKDQTGKLVLLDANGWDDLPNCINHQSWLKNQIKENVDAPVPSTIVLGLIVN